MNGGFWVRLNWGFVVLCRGFMEVREERGGVVERYLFRFFIVGFGLVFIFYKDGVFGFRVLE